uniref:Uncharacterized protein n=1 Tax=Ditylenchus dipsaci TaxID=166011 RepID=A0A915DKK7_9BILA
MWVAIRDDKISWEGTGNGAAHFCSGPKERSEVEGNQLRRSVIAEIATRSVEKTCSAVAKLEQKILDKAGNDQGKVIHQKIQLYYQEQAQCSGIRIGRVLPNEPNSLYSEISERLQDLQANLTQFSDDGFTEEQYAEVMSKYLSESEKGKNASLEEVEIVDEDESWQVDIRKLEPFVSDKNDEDKLKSFWEPNKVREGEPITLYSPIKKLRLNCEPNNPEKFLMIKGIKTAFTGSFSIAQHVYGSQHQHLEVQKNIMDKLLVCQDEQWASPLFGTADEIIHYVALHRKPGEWGGQKSWQEQQIALQSQFLLYKPELSTKFAYLET